LRRGLRYCSIIKIIYGALVVLIYASEAVYIEYVLYIYQFDDKYIFPCCFVFLCLHLHINTRDTSNKLHISIRDISHAAPIEESLVIRRSQHSCSNGVVSFIHPLRNVITSFSNPFPSVSRLGP